MDLASSPVDFDADGLPRSTRFGDVYFSRDGGLGETRAVFLAGCGLPERWASRRRFTVAELGFGTGLNIVALLGLWRAHRPPGARLSIFSVEADLMDREAAARALAIFPEAAPDGARLLDQWPERRAGFHRLEFPDLGASCDLAVMDAADALDAWSGRADAWFLDGFSPAVNPAMWTPDLISRVAARSAPGARLATYAVAGHVRRALTEAGFEAERRPGYGRKRHRLEARAPGEAPPDPPAPRVAIVGGGLAGAALARAFHAMGVTARVFEAASSGAGASGNPAALVTPRLDAGFGPPARLHAQAFDHARRLYRRMPGVVVGQGVLQLETTTRDAGRFARIAASDLFAPGALDPLSAEAATARLGEPAPGALDLAAALVVDPARILAAWLPDCEIETVSGLAPAGEAWRLLGAGGDALAEADVVCLAAGAALCELWPAAPIEPVRGQLTCAFGVTAEARAWGPYVAPTPGGGLMFGATHDRGDDAVDLRPQDDARNLAAVAARFPALARRIESAPRAARASVRATTPDRLPLAGEAAPGLFVLGGFGARGFTLAPLLAAHVAAMALGAPSPLPDDLAPIVAPARFALRARRRMALTRPQV